MNILYVGLMAILYHPPWLVSTQWAAPLHKRAPAVCSSAFNLSIPTSSRYTSWENTRYLVHATFRSCSHQQNLLIIWLLTEKHILNESWPNAQQKKEKTQPSQQEHDTLTSYWRREARTASPTLEGTSWNCFRSSTASRQKAYPVKTGSETG